MQAREQLFRSLNFLLGNFKWGLILLQEYESNEHNICKTVQATLSIFWFRNTMVALGARWPFNIPVGEETRFHGNLVHERDERKFYSVCFVRIFFAKLYES